MNITAFIPHYNYTKYINDAIVGLLNQTQKLDEICIVDDSSKPEEKDRLCAIVAGHLSGNLTVDTPTNITNVEKILSGYHKQTKIRVLFHKDNKGRAGACNTAIVNTPSAKIYAICDADDFYEPQKVEKSIAVMKKWPEVGMVYTDLWVWKTNENVKSLDTYRSFDYQLLTRRNCCNNNSIVIADMIRQVGLYDERLKVAEDYDMWLRLAEITAIYHLPEPLFTYRITGENETSTTKQEVWDQCRRLVAEKQLARRKKNDA